MNNFTPKILYLFIFLGLFACSENTDQTTENVDKHFIVKAFYCTFEQPGINKPDVNARVYIYYDIYTIDLSNSSYISDGKFLKKEAVIFPEQTYSIGSDGIVHIVPIYTDRKISVVIESDHYKNRLAMTSYSNFKTSITCTNLFQP